MILNKYKIIINYMIYYLKVKTKCTECYSMQSIGPHKTANPLS